MRFLNLPIETKAFGDSGSFEGYASIFGNVDLGGDVIERGAFKEIVKGRNGMVKILNQHRSNDPIGVAEVKQDDKGLNFKGQLILEAASARSAYALMKGGALDGMSIGYDVLDGGSKILESGIRSLARLKLWEISPVTFGMNELAGIDSVKGMSEDCMKACASMGKAMKMQQDHTQNPEMMTPARQQKIMDHMQSAHSAMTDKPPMMKSGESVRDIKEFEELLREVGFPRAAAKALASGGWTRLDDQRDVDAHEGFAKDILVYLSGLKFS